MTPFRSRLLVGAGIVIVFALDLFLLITGAHLKGLEERLARENIDQALVSHGRTLTELQNESNADRGTVVEAFDLLSQVVARARNAETLARAHELWPQVAERMDEARKANTRLSRTTERIMLRAQLTREDIEARKAVTNKEFEIQLLDALDKAMVLMIQTQLEYARLDDLIEEGFPLYEDLFGVTAEFLRNHRNGIYRSDSEAAASYSVRVTAFDQPLSDFTDRFLAIRDASDAAADQFREAFEEWERLRQQA